MMILRSILTLKTCRTSYIVLVFVFILFIPLVYPDQGECTIIIDVNSPSLQKINLAIPSFKNYTESKKNNELSTSMVKVISNDLDLSGYFTPMDKDAFIDEDGPLLTAENIRFKNWSVIGAELLLKGGYTCIGRNVEVEIRLYDVFLGRQVLGKKFLGKKNRFRHLMHRVSNEIFKALTGYEGMFLSKIAFVGTASGNKEIYICDFDGHNIRQFTSDKSIALLPKWSPSGDTILYVSYKEGGTILYMKGVSRGNAKRLSGRKGLNIGACWASNGEKLALTLSHKGNPDIFTIDLSGKILEQLTDHWGIDVSPSLSPDEKHIAFVSNRSGMPQIYSRDLQKKREERLTFEGKENTSPTWSSKNRIAFSRIVEGKWNIFTMNSDGSDVKALTENKGNNEEPCWSQDGRYIVFSSNRTGNYHLYIMNANGSNQRRITFQKGEQTAPSWSPF